MSSTYLGFDLQQMFHWLNEYCDTVILEKTSQGHWNLYTFSMCHGEYDNTGTLFMITTQAFKPFVDRAKGDLERSELKKLFK